MRDIFGLGAPLILDTTSKSNKISRFEKVQHLFCLHTATIPSLRVTAFFSLSFILVELQVPQKRHLVLLGFYCCTHVFILFFNSIFSTPLLSRPGLNRGTKSGTNGLTSCEKNDNVVNVRNSVGVIEMDPKWCLRYSSCQTQRLNKLFKGLFHLCSSPQTNTSDSR